MPKVLVLGGGGVVGVAWETAILAGLREEGVDVSDADLVIGTSAGSVVGTNLRCGRDPRDVMRERLAPPAERAEIVRPDPEAVGAVFRLWGSYDEMTQEARAEVGKLALAAPTAPEDAVLANFAVNGWQGWPDAPLLVCAVECRTGAFRAFEKDDDVPIERAVAASCAVPGLFPPITVDGGRYTDGGVRSWTSADLAMRAGPERALVIAPAGHDGPGVRGLAARQMQREIADLRARSVDVQVVVFDEAVQAACANLMDAASAEKSAEAGFEHGRRIAADIGGWWA